MSTIQINKILIAVEYKKKSAEVDFSILIRKALMLSKALNASVDIFTCGVVSSLRDMLQFNDENHADIKSKHIEAMKEFLREITQQELRAGETINIDAQWHEPFYEGVVNYTKEKGYDLLIVPVNYHSELEQIVFHNSDWQLMRQAVCPLLLIKDKLWNQELNITTAVDPAHEHDKPAQLDHELLNLSEYMSKNLPAKHYVIHSYRPVYYAVEYAREVFAIKMEQLGDLTDSHEIERSNVKLIQGLAEESIPKFVEEKNIDIVVMGSVSRSRLENVFIGHTAEEILTNVNSDVLVKKPGLTK